MLTCGEVELETLLDLRERALTPGHPGRPVIWPYDHTATHLAVFDEGAVFDQRRLMPAACDLLWATARPSELGFYDRCGFDRGSPVAVQPTGLDALRVADQPGDPAARRSRHDTCASGGATWTCST